MTLPPHPTRHVTARELGGGPDVPDAVVGWRTWRIGRRAQRRTDLVGPLAGTLWPAGRPLVATCASPHHGPPGDRCGCGLYGVADPTVLEWGPSDHEVLGTVALWGQVVEGTRGWRASHGYPRFLVTGPAIATEQRAAIARRYGVPVHRSDVPPRVLAMHLGTERVLADRLARARPGDVETLLAARMPEWSRRWHARAASATSGTSRRRPGMLRLARRRG